VRERFRLLSIAGLVLLIAYDGVAGSEVGSEAPPADAVMEQNIRAALEKNDFAVGQTLAGQLLELREKADGVDSISLIPALRWRGYFRALAGDRAGASDDFRRAYIIGERSLGANGPGLSQSALAELIHYLESDRDLLLSLLADQPDDPSIAAIALGISRSQKGRFMEITADRQSRLRTIAQSGAGDPEILRLLHDSDVKRSDYATMAFTAAQPFDSATVSRLHNLEESITQNENAASGLSGGAASMGIALQVDYDPKILAQTAPGMGNWFIDYAEYRRYRFDQGAALQPANPEYMGFLTRGDGSIVVARLGAAADIDALAQKILAANSDPLADYGPVAAEGYRRIVEPLVEKALPKAPHGPNESFEAAIVDRFIGIFPDGNLNLVAFQALRDEAGFLGDHFRIGYIGSALNLGPFTHQAVKPAFTVEVFADPDFSHTAPAHGERGSNAALLRQIVIPRLRGTEAEAAAVQSVLPKSEIHQGADASRQRFLALASPGILHLATHGMFLDDGAAQTGEPLGQAALSANGGYGGLALAPLIGTGLVLAGTPKDPMGGVVTATDILNMDLSSTQLVVLSACETARGYIRPGDSVYGLRHAFLLAGAETVVASLWEIDDAATKVLMARYYSNLARGMGRLDAMIDAARKQRKIQEHPAYWAPFVVMGSFGVLRGSADGAIPVMEPRTGSAASGYRTAAPTPPPEPASALFPRGKHAPKMVQDCDRCPPLIEVTGPRGGRLWMGKFEITFDDWAACELEKGCSLHPDMPFYGRGKRPVINVSRNDIDAYLAWLSAKAKKTYRLPTQAEWARAARGGGSTPIVAGRRSANCYGCDDETEGKEPAPVGSHEANALGLYDMLGNVWELTSDCVDESCKNVYARGGSYYEDYEGASSEAATTLGVGLRLNNVGFRVVRDD
jgi:CHAT domain-containing protein